MKSENVKKSDKNVNSRRKNADFSKRLGEKIGKLASKVGGKQALAKKLKISGTNLYRYISGERSIPDYLLPELAKELDISLDNLFIVDSPANQNFSKLDEFSPKSTSEPERECYSGSKHPHFLLLKDVLGNLKLDKELLCREFDRNFNDLAFSKISDDTMEPTLKSGDIVLVDLQKKSAESGGLYAVQTQAQLYFRRIQPLPDQRMEIICDNSAYKSFPIETIELKSGFFILGRIISVWRRAVV
ncbi:MAG: LexA family transcriptional regulator [Candidatus Riflebacteria bacterium]|nr:LexA family transcriptional regulator [Candidatus Riflebacteria bacterium]